MLYERLEGGAVRCALCAHRCKIADGRRGKCLVRENMGGTLESLVYGKVVSTNVDPIEKKPLFHFMPGSRSLSIATVGCNMKCAHCQNFEISRHPRLLKETVMPGTEMSAGDVVSLAVQHECGSISYTYTEPTIFMEFALDCAAAAHEKGIKNVFVSNGFMTPESAGLAAPLLDGINIDLKGGEEFYREVCGAHAGPVRDTIGFMKSRGVWVEVTTLIIPGLNDSEAQVREIAEFIRDVDPSIPWHVSRFYPTYRMSDRPPTPPGTLRRVREQGLELGLNYVYEGNVPGRGGEDTVCPACGELLVERDGFVVGKNVLGRDGRCPKCGGVIEGRW